MMKKDILTSQDKTSDPHKLKTAKTQSVKPITTTAFSGKQEERGNLSPLPERKPQDFEKKPDQTRSMSPNPHSKHSFRQKKIPENKDATTTQKLEETTTTNNPIEERSKRLNETLKAYNVFVNKFAIDLERKNQIISTGNILLRQENIFEVEIFKICLIRRALIQINAPTPDNEKLKMDLINRLGDVIQNMFKSREIDTNFSAEKREIYCVFNPNSADDNDYTINHKLTIIVEIEFKNFVEEIFKAENSIDQEKKADSMEMDAFQLFINQSSKDAQTLKSNLDLDLDAKNRLITPESLKKLQIKTQKKSKEELSAYLVLRHTSGKEDLKLLEEFKKKINGKKEKIAKLRSELLPLKKEIREIKEEIETIEGATTTIKASEQKPEIQTHIDKLNSEIQTIENDLKNKNKMKEQSKKLKEEKIQRLKELKKELAEKNNVLKHISERKEKLFLLKSRLQSLETTEKDKKNETDKKIAKLGMEPKTNFESEGYSIVSYLTNDNNWKHTVIFFGLAGDKKDKFFFMGIDPEKDDFFLFESENDSEKSLIKCFTSAICKVIDPKLATVSTIQAMLEDKLQQWERKSVNFSLSDKPNVFNEKNKPLINTNNTTTPDESIPVSAKLNFGLKENISTE